MIRPDHIRGGTKSAVTPAINSPNNSNSISNNETENCNRTVVVMGRPKRHDEDVLIKTITDI